MHKAGCRRHYALFHDCHPCSSNQMGLEVRLRPPVSLQMAEAKCGRPVKKIWFVWSVRDNHMLGSVLQHDGAYAQKQLPQRLPSSFSPDTIQVSSTHVLFAAQVLSPTCQHHSC